MGQNFVETHRVIIYLIEKYAGVSLVLRNRLLIRPFCSLINISIKLLSAHKTPQVTLSPQKVSFVLITILFVRLKFTLYSCLIIHLFLLAKKPFFANIFKNPINNILPLIGGISFR